MLPKDVSNSSDRRNSFWVLMSGRSGARRVAIVGVLAESWLTRERSSVWLVGVGNL